jgi:hypothetical protein
MEAEDVEETAPLKKHWTDGLIRCWWCMHWKEKDAVCCDPREKANL